MTPWDQLFLFMTGLFSVINPLGAVPVWLSMSAHHSERAKQRMLRKVWKNMLLLLLGILLFGTVVLSFFGLSLPAIQIGGAAMIIIHAFALLRGSSRGIRTAATAAASTGSLPTAGAQPHDWVEEEEEEEVLAAEDASFAPLTTPLLVGPGTIAIIISYSNQLGYVWSSVESAYTYGFMLLSILAMTLLTYYVLRYSSRLLRWLGSSGLVAASKVMGFLLLSVGMQIMLDALLQHFNR